MLRLAEVVRGFQSALSGLSPQQGKVCHQILRCRTAALGGFQLQCQECGEEQVLYHACRNRHCPRCQQQASEQWQQRELANVVDASYFHLVFTLPHELNGWVRLHPRVIYGALFSSVWDTLNTLGHDPKRLSGQLGMTAVLHTWGQNLSQHVHLHCLIPGGAIDCEQRWHPANSTYLFPGRVLSRLFRGKMVSRLRQAVNEQQLPRLTVMTLEGPEFLRRFLQHVLPHGFMRIRHFGWLANACRKQQLPLVRQAIAVLAATPVVTEKATDTTAVPGFEGIPCSCCKTGVMRVRYPLRPVQQDYG